MFIGGCSGSTSGSIKIGRILVLLKEGVIELRKLIHPRAVISPKIEGKLFLWNLLTISSSSSFYILLSLLYQELL